MLIGRSLSEKLKEGGHEFSQSFLILLLTVCREWGL